MKLRTAALASSLLLAFLAGCDEQASATSPSTSSGTVLSGVAAGRTVLAGASITVLDADSGLVWSGTTDDSGRYEARLPDSVKFPLEIVARKDTLELRTLAPWEDDSAIVSNVNPVTDLAFDSLARHRRLESIRSREEWVRQGDSVFAGLAAPFVDFRRFAVDPDFRGTHAQDSLLLDLAAAEDSLAQLGDTAQLRRIEEVVDDLSCRFGTRHEDAPSDIRPPAATDSLRTPAWEGDTASGAWDAQDSLVAPPDSASIDTAEAVLPDSLQVP